MPVTFSDPHSEHMSKSTTVTVVASSSDEDSESAVVFSPLNSPLGLSYSATINTCEVAPTASISQRKIDKYNKHKRSKNYGKPVGDDINTRHVSGKKIDNKHTQFALAAGMMLGVRECVGGINSIEFEVKALSQSEEYEDSDDDKTSNDGGRSRHNKRRNSNDMSPLILEEECARVEKVKIPAGAYFISSHVASLPYRYKFKAYAPHVFSRIRHMAGVEKQRFLHSICGNDAFIEFVSNAKSGQFFFYSHDGRYMIKTQTQEEKDFLRTILPHYYKHLKQNPHSFITHFYGMYRVKIPDLGKSIHFVIMKSVFNTEKEIHKIWDLKGSTLGRRAKRGDGVSKDLDIVDEGRKLKVGNAKNCKNTKEAIMSQLKKDADFLASMQIMDYSLLLGVHVCTKAEQESERKRRKEMLRSNTPLRRQWKEEMINYGGKEGVLKHFLESARDMLGMMSSDNMAKDEVQKHEQEESQLSDDDTDSDRDVSQDCGISSYDTDLRTVLSPVASMENDNSNPYTCRDDLGIESVSGDGSSKEIYFAGIIDILQLYNTRKWGETMMRKAIGNNEKAMSCVNPEAYAERFVEFIGDLIE